MTRYLNSVTLLLKYLQLFLISDYMFVEAGFQALLLKKLGPKLGLFSKNLGPLSMKNKGFFRTFRAIYTKY